MFYPIGAHKHLKNYCSSNDISALLNKECIILPSFPELTNFEVEQIAAEVLNYAEGI